MDLTSLEAPTATSIYTNLVNAINQAIAQNDLQSIRSIFNIINKYSPSKDPRMPSPEMTALNQLRAKGYITKLHLARTSLSKRTSSKMYEMSGYIPSESEKNDPRWKMSLTKDVRPGTMKQSAKKFSWKIKRDGTPPIM